MRIGEPQAKVDPEDVLTGALMSLLLAAGVLLSTGTAPAKNATFFIEAARAEAAEFASATPDSVSPGGEIAENSSPDIQLD